MDWPVPRATHRVVSPDGTGLAVQEWGLSDGPAILFLHGGMQSHRCWHRQVSDPALAAAFRMVTLDLRGHGDSDKPEGESRYREARPWADDVAAVLAELRLHRPTIVPWSFGGRVLGDYMALHGTDRIGAIDFVAARMNMDARHVGPNVEALGRAGSADPAVRQAGIDDFARLCFLTPPPEDELAAVVAYNRQVPAHVRGSMRERDDSYDDILRSLRIPAVATHGAEDRVLLPSLGRHVAALVPGCALSLYPGVGHSPFREDSVRFNRELAALARRAVG